MEKMGLNREFWTGKRVLVTGHTGFKGAWLSQWLCHLGAEVIGLSLSPVQEPNLFSLLDGPTEHLIGDIRDRDTVHRVLHEQQPDLVFHLAAQSLVRESYRAPVATFETNVMGTLHLLEALRKTPEVQAALVITTDKCYRNTDSGIAFKESDALGGDDPYSASKACTELLCGSYQTSYFQAGPRLATARAGNVIGGGDWASERLVPDIVRAVFEGQALQIRYPDATRPWQHVLEPLYGYLLLLQSLALSDKNYCGAWNFGPSPETVSSVRDLVSLVLQGEDTPLELLDQSSDMKEAQSLFLDSQKAEAKLGWMPRLDVVTTVKWTWDWYRAYYQGQNIKDFTLKQIKDYEARWLTL